MHSCRRTLRAALLTALLATATATAAGPPDQTSPLPNPTGCDSIDASACMLPFPNDLYTKADPSTRTGRRIDFSVLAMPRNIAQKPIDPTDWNRADGFSPGSEIVTKITGLDEDSQLDAIHGADGVGVARIWSPDASLDADAPIAVIDAATGEKQMVWAELDHSMDVLGAKGGDRDLIIRPAKNFLEGHRYIVALRLGSGVTADPTFVNYRDKGTPFTNPFDEQRRAHFESLFSTLDAAGIRRGDLTQAWDFTVATADSLAGRMLAIRNDAFHQLGDDHLDDLRVEGRAPTFTLQRVEDVGCDKGRPAGQDLIAVDAQCPGGQDGPIAYDVKGTMLVPCYMSTPSCAPMHSHFVLNPVTNLPVQIPGNTMKVDFRCRIPQVALDHPGESRPGIYGHGLFGGYGEIGQGQLKAMMAEHNFTFCATAWTGMATNDVPNALSVDADLSNFNTLGDRVQQGMLNFLYLGRLMIHPDGLCSQAAFNVDGQCILDTRRLFYDGNSQGGIIGGALTAVAPDFTRATLGVLGMNYSTLLSRSTDFGDGTSPLPKPLGNNGGLYAYPLYQAYPQASERQLLFGLIQMLWDRAEPDGYAQHMTSEPYPDTPPHQVMLMSAYGDHQVADITAETEARTVGAKVLKPDMIRPWRTWELHPWTGLQPIDAFPAHDVSVYTVWDGGSRPFPLANVAPSKYASGDDDPHEWIRNTVAARAMKSDFLQIDGAVVDHCTPYCDTDPRSAHPDDALLDPLAGLR